MRKLIEPHAELQELRGPQQDPTTMVSDCDKVRALTENGRSQCLFVWDVRNPGNIKSIKIRAGKTTENY